MTHGILYTQKVSNECVGFADADWAGDVNDRKSTSGYLFQMSGGPVTWRGKKQGVLHSRQLKLSISLSQVQLRVSVAQTTDY